MNELINLLKAKSDNKFFEVVGSEKEAIEITTTFLMFDEDDANKICEQLNTVLAELKEREQKQKVSCGTCANRYICDHSVEFKYNGCEMHSF